MRGVNMCVRKTVLAGGIGSSGEGRGGRNEGYAKARLSMAGSGELCKEDDDDGAHGSLINTTSRDDSREGRESGRPFNSDSLFEFHGFLHATRTGNTFSRPEDRFYLCEEGVFEASVLPGIGKLVRR